jgi:hypothetical protein
MRISTIIIGIIIMGFMTTGLYAITTDLASSNEGYNVSVDDSYASAFDKTTEISEEISNNFDELMGISENSDLGYITLVPKVGILVKNAVKLPFSVAGGMITSTREYLGLPQWTQTFMIVILTILFLFGVVSIILRYRYT